MEFLGPFPLNIGSRGNDDDSCMRIEITQKAHDPQGDVCFSHSHFIRQVSTGVASQHIERSDRAFSL